MCFSLPIIFLFFFIIIIIIIISIIKYIILYTTSVDVISGDIVRDKQDIRDIFTFFFHLFILYPIHFFFARCTVCKNGDF